MTCDRCKRQVVGTPWALIRKRGAPLRVCDACHKRQLVKLGLREVQA